MKYIVFIFILFSPFSILFGNHLKFQEPALLKGSENQQVTLQLALAQTPKEREKGLMFITKLEPYHGMLFCFDTEAYRAFWMKNTYISLDIIFMDKNMKIIGFIQNTTPLSLESLYIPKKSQYILEVNAGFIHKNKIQTNHQLQLLKKIKPKK